MKGESGRSRTSVCLFGAVANYHATNSGIIQRATALLKIIDYVVEHWLYKARMGIDELSVNISLLEFYGRQASCRESL